MSEGTEQHFSEEFEHAAVTDDNREAFNKFASKYATKDDALVGGFNASKLTGQPFKMPESMDKLPDDDSRADFTAQAHKLLGNEFADDIAGLIDMDLKVGSAEGTQTDEGLANAFKQFVVDNKVPKALAQKLLGFHNVSMGKATEAFKGLEDAKFDENVKKTNEGLVKHLGSQEKVDAESALFKRAILNHPGMTSDKAEEVADIFVDVMQKGGSDAAVVLLEMIAPMAREGGSHAGKGGNTPPAAASTKEQLPKTGAALGWK
jgi:hypothetical protein